MYSFKKITFQQFPEADYEKCLWIKMFTKKYSEFLWIVWSAVWLSRNVLVLHQRSCATLGSASTRMSNRMRAGKLSQCLTSHPGQLSLAIPPWVNAVSTSESALDLYLWCGLSVGLSWFWLKSNKTEMRLGSGRTSLFYFCELDNHIRTFAITADTRGPLNITCPVTNHPVH